MTQKRKIWFIVWAAIVVIMGIASGGFSAIFPLVLLGFIELIRLFVISVKKSKQKINSQQEHLSNLKEKAAIIEESLITTGLPPQNIPTAPTSFFQMLLLGILLTPIGLGILIYIAKSNTTKQQNRVKEARTQRGITLSTEAYTASEAYFDKQRAEASKAILPAILAWVILVIIVILISQGA